MTERTPEQIRIMKAWQQLLLDVAAREGRPDPLPKYGADGHGGLETIAAINAFQASRNPALPVTGQFDAATRLALNPTRPHISPAEIAIITGIISLIPGIPPSLKELLMFPTIVQFLVGLLPGIPDDLSKINAELKELASTDSGVAKIRSAIAFGRAFLNEAERVLNVVDPSAAIAASTPIPPAVAALAPAAVSK